MVGYWIALVAIESVGLLRSSVDTNGSGFVTTDVKQIGPAPVILMSHLTTVERSAPLTKNKKTLRKTLIPLGFLIVGGTELESVTSTMSTLRSNQLSITAQNVPIDEQKKYLPTYRLKLCRHWRRLASI